MFVFTNFCSMAQILLFRFSATMRASPNMNNCVQRVISITKPSEMREVNIRWQQLLAKGLGDLLCHSEVLEKLGKLWYYLEVQEKE